jgi:hypothetical protein
VGATRREVFCLTSGLFIKHIAMKEKETVRTACAGLLVGCVLGLAGSVIPSSTFRNVAWATGSAGIILAGALLAMRFFRNGRDGAAAGFLTLAIGEALVFSSCATNLDENISSFGAGTFLWALAIASLSIQKTFPLFARLTGIIAAGLFCATAILIFTGHQVNALAKPLPFLAYPFYAITLIGWAWTLLKNRSPLISVDSVS